VAKQVEDIVVRLVGEGFEALDKIKGSFRELGKVTNLAEKDILSARDSLLDYARKAGNTEAVNKGLGDAFKGLRSQVDLCSDAYRVLSADLRQIDEVSRGATQSVMAQRDAVLASTAAGTQNVAALQQQRAALIALRAQTRDASTAFDQFSADIAAVETRLTNLAEVNRRFNAVIAQGTAATAAGARVQLEALTDGIALRRQDLAVIDTRSARERNLRATIEQRLGIEQRLNTALSMRRRIQFQEGARTGREGARTGAATFNDPTVTAGFLAPDRIAQRLGDLPNTTAGLSQELGELNERLVNTYRNTETYIAVQLRLADVQRQVSAATQGFGAALRAQLDTGTLIPSQKNLAEVIGELRREMRELDTTTTAGAQAYANNARQADQLERQLRELASAYRQVGSTATTAATAEQNAANARIRNNYLGRGAVRQQEQALRELGDRVQQGVAATPLLLPAAGQTSAPGTGQARSGGARNRLIDAATNEFVSGVEATFTESLERRLKTAGERSGYFNPPTVAVGTAPAVGFAGGAGQRDALAATDAAARATEQQMQRLRAAVDTATKANTGSVTSLGRLREALVNLRNEIPGTEKEFRDLNQQVEGVDRRSSRLQTRRRPSTGQLVQAGGAAISGGIFGGPEGFLGGVGGAVLGTVLPGIGTAGGAFAGAAAGAQVGMFRQQLAGTADYAASIGKLQIALRGVVGSQEAYDAAIRAAAAATRDLNIPQEEATRGLTRLSAAVIGAGGTVADSSFAFRAMSEAIKATGGNAEQVDGALLALTQVFSKGKVSAEELNQIAERLPGTFTLFATGRRQDRPRTAKSPRTGRGRPQRPDEIPRPCRRPLPRYSCSHQLFISRRRRPPNRGVPGNAPRGRQGAAASRCRATGCLLRLHKRDHPRRSRQRQGDCRGA
jgi:tape measure domain-containing protein